MATRQPLPEVEMLPLKSREFLYKVFGFQPRIEIDGDFSKPLTPAESATLCLRLYENPANALDALRMQDWYLMATSLRNPPPPSSRELATILGNVSYGTVEKRLQHASKKLGIPLPLIADYVHSACVGMLQAALNRQLWEHEYADG
jgi:hypothetical protein